MLAAMPDDKFKELCERVIVPRVTDLLHAELAEQKEILGTILRETIRLRDEVEALEFALANEGHADS
jgi:hypothetical protein